MVRAFLLMICLTPALFGQTLYKNFEYVTVAGKIVTTEGEGLAGIRVEIFAASRGGSEVSRGTLLTNPMAVNTSRMERVSWTDTLEDGSYLMEGVPSPGDYFVAVKPQKGFQKMAIGLRIDKTRGTEYKDVDLTLLRSGEKAGFKAADNESLPLPKKLAKKYKKAQGYFTKGKWDKAAAISEELVTAEPGFGDGYIMLGNIAVKQQQYPAALDWFSKAMDAGVANKSLAYSTAQLAFAQQKFDQSLRFAKESLKFDEKDSQSLYLAGMSAFNLHNWEEADSYLDRFHENMDYAADNRNYFMIHGLVKLTLKDYERAVGLIEDAAKNGIPKNENWYRALIAAHQALGHTEDVARLQKEMKGGN
ncbi:MAG: CDC27 family protein [Acidobacteriota bacterium]|nr:CDC27 family protein [Acidobacteriota bacterium]